MLLTYHSLSNNWKISPHPIVFQHPVIFFIVLRFCFLSHANTTFQIRKIQFFHWCLSPWKPMFPKLWNSNKYIINRIQFNIYKLRDDCEYRCCVPGYGTINLSALLFVTGRASGIKIPRSSQSPELDWIVWVAEQLVPVDNLQFLDSYIFHFILFIIIFFCIILVPL